MTVAVNWLAILVSVVAGFVIGFLWHGPLFGKVWAREMGIDMSTLEPKPRMAKPMVMTVIGLFLLAYVLSHGLTFGNAYLKMSGAGAGMMGGFWYWLGFIVPLHLGTVAWEKKSWKLFAINAGYWLVLIVVMGGILSGWQ